MSEEDEQECSPSSTGRHYFQAHTEILRTFGGVIRDTSYECIYCGDERGTEDQRETSEA